MNRPLRILTLVFPLASATAQAGQPLNITAPVTISTQDCQALARHVPSPDVAYKPGVDVHGKAVAPADLDSGGGWQPPRTITFPLVINPFNPQGTAATAAAQQFATTQMPIAKVTVDTVTGDVLLDGKPVAPTDAQAIAVECRKRGM